MQGHEKRRSIVHDGLLLAARLLMTASMIRFGAGKLMDISLFVDNPVTLRFMEALADGTKAPLWFAYSNAIFQTAAGIFVLVGFHARSAALLLFGWIAVLTYFGHPFWSLDPADRPFHESLFFRNLALAAAYLMIVATGPGRFSLDAITRPTHLSSENQ